MNKTPPDAIDAAVAFVAEHGVVLASARGEAPRLVDFIAGEQIVGNWWSHRRAKEVYNVLASVQESTDVLTCRLLDGKITLVHRRLWPALVRLAGRLEPRQVARVSEQHSVKGHHVKLEVPFPEWVPANVLREAASLPEVAALESLGRWLR
jgi:hypothetical protein